MTKSRFRCDLLPQEPWHEPVVWFAFGELFLQDFFHLGEGLKVAQ